MPQRRMNMPDSAPVLCSVQRSRISSIEEATNGVVFILTHLIVVKPLRAADNLLKVPQYLLS